MKNYIALVKQSLLQDIVNLYLFWGSVIFFLIDFVIWRLELIDKDIYIATFSGIFPIRYLAIVMSLNTLLAVFSYDKEKEISYLLFSANIFVAILILVLEIFYLINLNGYA